MNYWLVKSEPDDCGIQHFVDKGAQRFVGTGFVITKRAISCEKWTPMTQCSCTTRAAKSLVLRDAEGDPSSLPRSAAVRRGLSLLRCEKYLDQPRWTAVDLVLDRAFRTVIGRAQLQSLASFADSPLTGKGSRLSVMPITKTQWSDVVQIASVIEDY